MTMATEYPKQLLKHIDGNWHPRLVETAEQEAQVREQGFKTAEDLWPSEKPRPKAKA